MNTITGYHVEDKAIATSEGDVLSISDSTNPSDILDFLLLTPGDIKVFWNLDLAVAKLLRILVPDRKAIVLLYNRGDLELFFGDREYTLDYYQGKWFSIKAGKHIGRPYAGFSDTEQFHKQQVSVPGNPFKSVLDKSEVAAKYAQEVYDTLVHIGLNPKTITSPIRPYEAEMFPKIDPPTVDGLDEVDEDISRMYYEACYGGWMEAFKIGHWDNVYDYDIIGAYPNALASIPDIRKGEWERTTDFADLFPAPEDICHLGIASGTFTPRRDAPIHPIPLAREKGGEREMFTAAGPEPTTTTVKAIKYVYDHCLGEFELDYAWVWYPTEPLSYPFLGPVVGLNIHKNELTGLPHETIKRIMAGLYGKMIERYRDGTFGRWFSPLYACETETVTRLKVMDFILDAKYSSYGCEPLHVAVDGCILDLPFVMEDSNKLGDWRLSSSGPCIIVSSGIVGMSGREKESLDFSLNYDKLRSVIESDPDARTYNMKKTGFVSITKLIRDNRKFDELGQYEEVSRIIDVTYEGKRDVDPGPTCGRDLLTKQYDTEPWDAELIAPGIELQ